MDQRQFFVRDILTVVFKHLKLIIVFPIVLFLIVGGLNYIWPPTYESEAKVRIIKGREVMQADPTVTRSAQEISMHTLTIEDINSEIELLQNTDLLRNVVEDLGLHTNPRFPDGDGILQQPIRAAKQVTRGVLYVLQLLERPDPVQRAMDQLGRALNVEPIRDSYVLDVRLRLGDKALAKEVLASVLAEYEQQHIRLFRNEVSIAFFTEQRNRARGELDRSQNALREYRRANNISLLDTEKELLLEQYADARRLMTQLLEIETAVDVAAVEQIGVASLSSETESPVVREMQLRLLELMLERNRVIQSLGPRHPTVQSLHEQVRLAQADLNEAIQATIRITEAKLATNEQRLQQLNDTVSELATLERDVETWADAYERYAEKLEESIIANNLGGDEFRVSSVRVASPPTLPINPVRPNKLLNLALALFGGLVAALGLAFLFDYLDHGLKTPEDVEHYVKVPPLASFFNSGGKPLDTREAERLATMLDTMSPTGATQLIEVASSVSQEGSHLVASALAEAYANDPDGRTLLVDFTGEIPRGRGSNHGLTDVLLEQASFDDVFSDPDGGRLVIAGRGSQSEYPAYLWGSERMRQVVSELRKRFKHIIFHAGPVLQSHDAIKLASHSDGVLLVIKADATRREVVTRASGLIKESNAKVLGGVLTERTQTIPSAVYRRI